MKKREDLRLPLAVIFVICVVVCAGLVISFQTDSRQLPNWDEGAYIIAVLAFFGAVVSGLLLFSELRRPGGHTGHGGHGGHGPGKHH
jgi:Mn2+/Fe2+ NRAMP family transporter